MLQSVRLSGAGVTLEADLRGPPEAPPVLLMHGGGQTRHAWKKAAKTLAEQGYRAVSIDLRGHGGSDWSEDGIYGLERYIADGSAVLDQLGGPVALVGASMGGATALALAAERPDDVSAIILVDFTPKVDKAAADRIVGFMRDNLDGFASVEEAAEAVAAYMPHRPRPPDTNGLRKNLRQRDDGRFYWHWDPRLVQQPATSREAIIAPLTEAARAIRAPTLIVRGGISEVVPHESVEHLRSLIPHAEAIDIAGAAHMVVGDRNDNFNDAVIGFLARTVPTALSANGRVDRDART